MNICSSCAETVEDEPETFSSAAHLLNSNTGNERWGEVGVRRKTKTQLSAGDLCHRAQRAWPKLGESSCQKWSPISRPLGSSLASREMRSDREVASPRGVERSSAKKHFALTSWSKLYKDSRGNRAVNIYLEGREECKHKILCERCLCQGCIVGNVDLIWRKKGCNINYKRF